MLMRRLYDSSASPPPDWGTLIDIRPRAFLLSNQAIIALM